MKAYQVFHSDVDKHGRPTRELVATYLDKDRAFEHAERIAKETQLHGDILEFDGWYGENKYASWSVVGWDRMKVSLFQEIEITE